MASEADVDLDGDGVDELLLLYYSHIEEEYGIVQNWRGLIYDHVEHGYVKAAEIPLDILTNGTCERWVRLVNRDGRTAVAVIRDDEWDGFGGMTVRVTIFDYDGEKVTVALLANNGFTCGSFIATGSFSLDWLKRVENGDMFYGQFDATTIPELQEGQNFFYYNGFGSVEHTQDKGAAIRQETLENLVAIGKGSGQDHSVLFLNLAFSVVSL